MIYKVFLFLFIVSFQISAQPVPSHYYKLLQKDSLYYLLTDKALFKFYSNGASGEFYLTRYIEGNFNSSTNLMLNDDHLFISSGDSIFFYTNSGAWDLSFENVFITHYTITGMYGFGPYFFIRSGNYYNLLKVNNGLVVPVEDSLFTHPSQELVFFVHPYVTIAQTVYKYIEGFDFFQVGQISIGNGNTGLTGDTLVAYYYYISGPFPGVEHSTLEKTAIAEPSFPTYTFQNWGMNITQLHDDFGWGTLIAKQNLYYMTWVNVITTRNSTLAYLPSQSDQVALTDNYIFLLGDSVRYSKWYAGSTFYSFNWTDVTLIKDGWDQPSICCLYQNYPNPFNPITKIKFRVAGIKKVKLKVYDVLGKEIKTLVDEMKSTGTYEVDFDGTNLSSGVYLYRIEIDNYSDVKKIILLK